MVTMVDERQFSGSEKLQSGFLSNIASSVRTHMMSIVSMQHWSIVQTHHFHIVPPHRGEVQQNHRWVRGPFISEQHLASSRGGSSESFHSIH